MGDDGLIRMREVWVRGVETNLDGVRVGGALGGVDELISEALSDGLDVAES